jgi:hypothetical protein|tara:strand:+ start:3242 stop:3607 length:366 start_codon:yes stop_codon:yes gene_type:complete
MDGAIDMRLIVTVVGIIVSMAGAAAVGKMQIKSMLEKLDDTEQRLRVMDRRTDAIETASEKQEQRINILAQMSSPENLRRDHMLLANIIADISHLQTASDKMSKIHANGVHPPVASERKAT